MRKYSISVVVGIGASVLPAVGLRAAGPSGLIGFAGQTPLNTLTVTQLSGSLTPGTPHTSNLGAFTITIVPGPTLAANLPALAAFNRAAQTWASRISDPVAVTINADMGSFGDPNIIGSTNAVSLQGQFDFVRTQLIADANAQPASLNNQIINSLPTNSQFTATLPSGRSFLLDSAGADPNQKFIAATKANFKAMGFTGLDAGFGASDGTITFNQAFNFDYDRSNGVTAGQTDFETTATHEIGHLLGFTSDVDNIAGSPTQNGSNLVVPTVLDLFRFSRTGTNPSTVSQFTTNPRNLTPGADTITDDLTNEYRMSSGLNTLQFPSPTGTDGRQASHWKADELTGQLIGIMDPTLSSGTFQVVTDADYRALDLIGWDVQVPEPGSLAVIALGAVGLLSRRRRAGTTR
jgi:hypothetical protein